MMACIASGPAAFNHVVAEHDEFCGNAAWEQTAIPMVQETRISLDDRATTKLVVWMRYHVKLSIAMAAGRGPLGPAGPLMH